MPNHPNRKRRVAVAAPSARPRREPKRNHDAEYEALRTLVASSLLPTIAERTPLFRTDAADLFGAYLKALPNDKQTHNCSACRSFINNYGGLVVIDESGLTRSAIWPEKDAVPDFYKPMIRLLRGIVERATVTDVFVSAEPHWGTGVTGEYRHFTVSNPNLYRGRVLTAGQAMAQKRQDFATVKRALQEFQPQHLDTAVKLLEGDHLYRSEKFVGPLQWLADLQQAWLNAKSRSVRAMRNVIWKAIATAPDGYCHPRSAVTGSLIEDIATGADIATVKRRFDDKTHPLRYQRPQAPPKAGNIANAEKIVEKLGIERSLERRYARLDEVEIAWEPTRLKPSARRHTGGVFAAVKPRDGSRLEAKATLANAGPITWEKFVRTVLPAAEKIEVDFAGRGIFPFIAMTTALHADAPPIIRWDRAEERNPFSWYLYHGGSMPSTWNLDGPTATVSAIVPLPTMWGDKPQTQHGEGYILVLDGCRDMRTPDGNALFPEHLIGDLHAARATIESFSRTAKLHGAKQASVCGLDVRKGGGNSINYRLRVTAGGIEAVYNLDRWD